MSDTGTDRGAQAPPSPERLFAAATAFQQTATIKAAVELDLFAAIGDGADAAGEIAGRCGAAERGIRILCDALTVYGFLEKSGGRYALTPDSAMFLDSRSPAYAGRALEFLLAPTLIEGFANLTGAVRNGGAMTSREEGALAPDHPMWVRFARAMVPLTVIPARILAGIVNGDGAPRLRVLDIAAGHGLFGVTVASQNPNADVVAVDWPNVLEVASENAARAGVGDRHRALPGSAFDVDFGDDYDVVLITNFLHHFDCHTNVSLLKKARAALRPDGRAVAVEFVPNEDRVSPPIPATFALSMLTQTPHGDTYTFRQLDRMFQDAGFSRCESRPLTPAPQTAVIGYA